MKMVAYCGLRCDTCPIYLATREQDITRQHAMRKDIARQCKEIYGTTLLPEEINDCDGCKAGTGRLFSGCMNCEIRQCAENRKLQNCAFCTYYACEILKKHFALDPSAKERLDSLRLKN
jgi:hypothetical protein